MDGAPHDGRSAPAPCARRRTDDRRSGSGRGCCSTHGSSGRAAGRGRAPRLADPRSPGQPRTDGARPGKIRSRVTARADRSPRRDLPGRSARSRSTVSTRKRAPRRSSIVQNFCREHAVATRRRCASDSRSRSPTTSSGRHRRDDRADQSPDRSQTRWSLLRYSEDRQVIDVGFVLTDELRAISAISTSAATVCVPVSSKHSTPTIRTPTSLPRDRLACARTAGRTCGDTTSSTCTPRTNSSNPSNGNACSVLAAVHCYSNGGVSPPRVAAEGPYEQLVDVLHPVVRAHPVTGTPALYFDLDRATHIDGLPPARGASPVAVAAGSRRGSTHPAYAHAWRQHDVLHLGQRSRFNTRRPATSRSASLATFGAT